MEPPVAEEAVYMVKEFPAGIETDPPDTVMTSRPSLVPPFNAVKLKGEAVNCA
jgi:hypothetical protein